MRKEKIKKILEEVRKGQKKVSEAMEEFRDFPIRELGYAKIDTHRGIRKGTPEIIFCKGKRIEHIKGIFKSHKDTDFIMATRADRRVYDSVLKVSPKAVFYEQAGIIFAGRKKRKSGRVISVVSAGTADIPVAEEAAVTSELLGNRTRRVYDAGVAGIHRIISCADQVKCANVVIVVAGMEGALASVVGGMVDRPVIAVPTSIGYGAGFEGLAPLLAMINSCAPGIAVVNIDNGFGAGYIASLINGK